MTPRNGRAAGRHRLQLFGLAILALGGAVQASELQIADGGKTAYVVVIPAQATVEESTAATWLAETLQEVTGTEFAIAVEGADDLPPTRLCVGHTAAAGQLGIETSALQPEEWRIKSAGETLILAGGRPRGTIYAVCEFLETHVGVLRLDPFAEYVPRSTTLTIPALDRAGRPAFAARFVFTGFPYSHSAVQGVNGARWRVWNKEHIYAGPATGDYPRMVPDGVHTFGRFISSQEFAATHPEYFSLDADGRRMTDDRGQPALWTQLCVTNADVRRIVLERAAGMLRDDRVAAAQEGREPAAFLVLSQNDNTQNLCLCPECSAAAEREGSESGPLLEFVNYVARGLRDEFPDVTVLTEAYNFTLQPPRTVQAEPNVLVRYCDNYGASDMTRPLTHPLNERPLRFLEGWGNAARGLGLWDYWRTIESAPPGLFAPSSNVRAMHRDIRRFAELGGRFFTVEIEDFMGMGGFMEDWGSNDLQSFLPLRTWLGMKLADDPSRDLEATLAAFCRGYYGDACGPMRELLEVIERRQEQVAARSCDRRRHVWLAALCDAQFFVDAYRCLDAAVEAVAHDAAALSRVRRERIVIDSAFLWNEAAARRLDPATAAAFPPRAVVLGRRRSDWNAYLAVVYDADGQALAKSILETGCQLIERLRPEDADPFREAVAVSDAEFTHDGELREPFWEACRPLRLLPRDPTAPLDETSAIRFAWSPAALVVGIQQQAATAAASWEVSLMAADRQGIQVDLFAQPSGSVGAYFYRYPASGMEVVPGRTSQSRIVSTRTDTTVAAEFRIPWSDLAVPPATTLSYADEPGAEFLVNVAAFPKLDSPSATHHTSPWLIGASPPYDPAYHAVIRRSR